MNFKEIVLIVTIYILTGTVFAQDATACSTQLAEYQVAYSQYEIAEENLREPTRKVQLLLELLSNVDEAKKTLIQIRNSAVSTITLDFIFDRFPPRTIIAPVSKKLGGYEVAERLINYCIIPIRSEYADAISEVCRMFIASSLTDEYQDLVVGVREGYTLGDLVNDLETIALGFTSRDQYIDISQQELNKLANDYHSGTQNRSDSLDKAWNAYANYQECVDQNLPDLDDDIVPDGLDDCPTISGDVIYNGCPPPTFEPPDPPFDTCITMANAGFLGVCETVYIPIYGCEHVGNNIYRWESWQEVFIDSVLVAEVYVGGPYSGSWHDGCPQTVGSTELSDNSGDDTLDDGEFLTQTFDDGTLSFNYPDGWVVDLHQRGVMVGNSREIIDNFVSGPNLPDDGFALLITPFDADVAGNLGQNTTEMLETLEPQAVNITETSIIGGKNASHAYFPNESKSLFVTVIEVDGHYALVIALSSYSGIDQWMQIFEPIVASMSVNYGNDTLGEMPISETPLTDIDVLCNSEEYQCINASDIVGEDGRGSIYTFMVESEDPQITPIYLITCLTNDGSETDHMHYFSGTTDFPKSQIFLNGAFLEGIAYTTDFTTDSERETVYKLETSGGIYYIIKLKNFRQIDIYPEHIAHLHINELERKPRDLDSLDECNPSIVLFQFDSGFYGIYLDEAPAGSVDELAGDDIDDVICEGAPQSRLIIGEQGQVILGLGANNVRNQASTSGQDIGAIPGGGIFSILDGPVCAEGYAWWQVDYNGIVGWTAEGQNNTYWLEPLTDSEFQSLSEFPPEDVVGTWRSFDPDNPDIQSDFAAYVVFTEDGEFSFEAFETSITGTYIFIDSGRVELDVEVCGVVGCERIVYETFVFIEGDFIRLRSPFGQEGVYKKVEN